MAIIAEIITIGNNQYVHTYSDSGLMIHGGFPEGDYEEAYDPVGSDRVYTETDVSIQGDAIAETIVDILTGVIE